jgi:hypothetical protein
MGRDTGITTLRVVAMGATTMEEDFTPANPTPAILVGTGVMGALFPTEANIPPIRMLTLDVRRGVAMVTATSIAGSILVVTTPQVAMRAMTSTEVDIMVQLIMVEAMMSAVSHTTTADMAATKEVTANTEEIITMAIDLEKGTV